MEKQATGLEEARAKVSAGCVECGLCVKECGFLTYYGTPKKLADEFDPEKDAPLAVPFECSLCGLCNAVCPFGVEPSEMFLKMRREAVARNAAPFPAHKNILAYEKTGISKRFTWYSLPEGAKALFFPGCALPGTRPETTLWTFEKLKEADPLLGIALDCCTKPSHDLGRQEFFQNTFGELKAYLLENGIEKVIVACPNCWRVFREYAPELAVSTVYEELPGKLLSGRGLEGDIFLHDPCVMRNAEEVAASVRGLAAESGLKVIEPAHSGKKTICCGEGGSVGFVAPDLAKTWTDKRVEETGGGHLVTYCAGCANFLGKRTQVSHILDLCRAPEETAAGREKVTGGLLTYLNRLKVKRRLKASVPPGSRTRERDIKTPVDYRKLLRTAAFLAVFAALIIGVRALGLAEYLEEEKLKGLISGFGPWAPALFMLLYTLAPTLMLPGLPLSIVGGVLFGPFWGVVYVIISATMGATLAFLVSRYIARGFIEKKLVGSRWKKLDEDVAKNGWKVVAFTRLVPLFPFNLLNYALGLTRIGLVPYVVTSFICMLPATIAFIVFSSSLLDLLKGKVSPQLILGIILIVLVSMIPVLIRRAAAKKEAQKGLAVRKQPYSFARSMKLKAKLLALAGAGWLTGGWAVKRFEYAVGGYLVVWEFYANFFHNRLADRNIHLLTDFLSSVSALKFPVLVALGSLIETLYSPFAPLGLAKAAVAAKGAAFGLSGAAMGIFAASLVFFALGWFLFGDLIPLFLKDGHPKARKGLLLFGAAIAALPFAPLFIGPALAAAARANAKNTILLLTLSVLVRAALSLFL